MKFLVDTHLLLWAANEPRRLSRSAHALLACKENELIFSAASLWEVAIKESLGRSDFRADPNLLRRSLLDNGYIELPISSSHAVAVCQLPRIHNDPFDRLLIAQAIVEGISLATNDEVIAQYPGPIHLV
jgi:PIN domain nuclease of toxin-antitoxin system